MSSNLEEENTEGEIEEKLKGDAIGGTMYTQRFVLKTLLKLKDLEWNEELEDDLCFLWDSTIEKEVCDYLMDVNFPSIACSVILEYNTIEYGRLTEILVGLLANILTAKCDEKLEIEQIDVILNLLVSTDSLVLIQVMRFLTAFSHNCESLGILTDEKIEDMYKLIKFILRSTTNFELIQKTLEALTKLTENSKTKVFFRSEMLRTAVNSCMRTITEDDENDFELFTSDQRNTVKYLIEYILNYCVYANSVELNLDLKECSLSFQEFFFKVTEWYSTQENLLPITDELLFYFEAVNYIFLTVRLDFNMDIFKNISIILKILLENDCEDTSEFVEMFCYFLHKANMEELKINLEPSQCKVLKKVCSVLVNKDLKCNFDFDKSKLREFS